MGADQIYLFGSYAKTNAFLPWAQHKKHPLPGTFTVPGRGLSLLLL